MTGTHCLVEGKIDPRWPINTRGNIGEVFPEVLTPLTCLLGVPHAEAGYRDALKAVGIYKEGDFASDAGAIIGLYGGYGYLNLSYLRISACARRAPRPRRSTPHSSASATRGSRSACPSTHRTP